MQELNETLTELGLTANPFADSTPLETLFSGGMRRASLDQLQLLSRESSDIVALIGPDGSGKTLLVDFFARRAERDQIVARTRASMLTTPSQLLQDMFKAFVLDFPAQASIAELKAALSRYFQTVRNQSRTVVLIVDDAHELGDDAFSLLVKLALVENAGSTFHLVLVGQISLLDMLDYTCPQSEGQNQFTSIALPPFNLDETRNYLRYRFHAVGFNEEDAGRALPFSNRQVEKIQKLSGGVPGQINKVAGEMLLNQGRFLPGLPSLPQIRLPRQYTYAAGALFAILLLAFLFGGGEEANETAQRQILLPAPQTSAVPSPIPLTEEASEEEVDASPFADSIALVSEVTPEPAAVSDDDHMATPAASGSVPEIERQEVVAGPEVVASQSEQVQVVQAQDTEPSPAASTLPAPVAVSQPAITGVSSAASGNLSQREQILAFPAGEYTVQLLGASSRSNVEAFVQRNSNSPLYWFETRLQGRPWFVVIHGRYPNRAAAQAAASALTGELGRLEPWIRSFNAVQGDIRATN